MDGDQALNYGWNHDWGNRQTVLRNAPRKGWDSFGFPGILEAAHSFSVQHELDLKTFSGKNWGAVETQTSQNTRNFFSWVNTFLNALVFVLAMTQKRSDGWNLEQKWSCKFIMMFYNEFPAPICCLALAPAVCVCVCVFGKASFVFNKDASLSAS